MKEDDLVTELVDFVCGDCGSKDWTLKIGRRNDGKVFLIVTCGNQVCLEKRRTVLNAAPEALVVWEEFELPADHPLCSESNDMPTEIN